MKTLKVILKLLAAAAAISGIVYVIATYGDKIVAWAKNLLGCCPCNDDCENCNCEGDCDTCECCNCEEIEEVLPVEEAVPAEEAPAAEEPAVEEAPAAEEPAAEESDFAE